jgi:spore coat polysaccharide biosynthesis predicted glycosyltransferase SpsG
MAFVFRADASLSIGSGHIVRCIAVAEALKIAGEEVIHVGEISNLPWLTDLLLTGPFSQFGVDESDYQPTQEDVLVIDSYYLDPNENFLNSNSWKTVACFVDRSTPQFHADSYFNLAPNLNWRPSSNDQNSPIYSGVKYIPVRTIHKNREVKLRENDPIKVVITSGGSDINGLTQHLVSTLCELDSEFEVEVFSNESIEADSRFTISDVGQKLSDSLNTCDLVLTAAGSTIWELLSRKIPFGVACSVKNQEENFEYLASHDLATPIGKYSAENGWVLYKESLSRLIDDVSLRADLKSRMDVLKFGDGAENIAQILIDLSKKPK